MRPWASGSRSPLHRASTPRRGSCSGHARGSSPRTDATSSPVRASKACSPSRIRARSATTRTPSARRRPSARSTALRYAMPGDWAIVHDDQTITLLGRGSGCINTGGEKVWPEEVEEVLKNHPAVVDAIVVGVPDEEWGESVAAVVSLGADHERRSADARRTVGVGRPAHRVVQAPAARGRRRPGAADDGRKGRLRVGAHRARPEASRSDHPRSPAQVLADEGDGARRVLLREEVTAVELEVGRARRPPPGRRTRRRASSSGHRTRRRANPGSSGGG